MPKRRVTSAAQVAASRRNLVKARARIRRGHSTKRGRYIPRRSSLFAETNRRARIDAKIAKANTLERAALASGDKKARMKWNRRSSMLKVMRFRNIAPVGKRQRSLGVRSLRRG